MLKKIGDRKLTIKNYKENRGTYGMIGERLTRKIEIRLFMKGIIFSILFYWADMPNISNEQVCVQYYVSLLYSSPPPVLMPVSSLLVARLSITSPSS